MIIVFQPALPAYRRDFFERSFDLFRGAMVVNYSPSELGVLTSGGHTYCWANRVGSLYTSAVGYQWQSGVLSVPIKRGDIIIVSGAPRCLTNILLLLKARFRGAKTAWWGHYWSSTSKRHRFLARMLLMRLSDAVLFYTDQEVVEYRSTFGVNDRRPIAALNNGIDVCPIQKLRAPYNPTQRPNAGLFIGRLTQKANLDLTLRAMLDVRLADFRLHVIGDGPELPCLQKLASTLHLDDRVIWHGATVSEDNIAVVANTCRLFVYPGSVGLSLIHGMAYGLPAVIHSDRYRHMPEVAAFCSQRTGVVFEHGDPASLANALSQLTRDCERLASYSRACLALTDNDFNTASMAARFYRFVSDVSSG